MATFSQYSLHLLVLLAIYAGIIDLRLDGLADLARKLGRNGDIPGVPGALAVDITGYKRHDLIVNFYVQVLWAMGQGPLSALLLQSIVLVGGCAGSLFLLMLEAGQTESLSRIVVKVNLFAFVGQFVNVASITPLLCAWDLRSHSELSSTRDSRPANLTIIRNLNVYVLGLYLAFSSFLFIPTPNVLNYLFRQRALILYQYWGVPVSAALALACHLQKDQTKAAARRHLRSAIASKLRSNYLLAIACTAIPYWGVVLTSLATTWLPFRFLEGNREDLSLARVFLPQPLWVIPPPVTSTAEGLERFLPYDYIISGATVLFWATARYIRTCEVERLPVDYSRLFLKALGLLVAAGPHGAAAVLFWRRSIIVEKALSNARKSK